MTRTRHRSISWPSSVMRWSTRHVKLDRCCVDGQHLDRAQRGKQPGRQIFAGEFEPWHTVLLEDHHNGVRLDAHQAV